MTTIEMTATYDAVADALRKRPVESLLDAAARVMSAPQGNPAWWVAREVLKPRNDPWASMRRAARAAKRIARRAP